MCLSQLIKKLNSTERGARFRHFCVSKVITTAHAHQSGVIFSFFSRAFKQKKIKALRPKMTKIASRGGSCLKIVFWTQIGSSQALEAGKCDFDSFCFRLLTRETFCAILSRWWSIARDLCGFKSQRHSSVSPLLDQSKNLLLDDKEKANLLNDVFINQKHIPCT